MKNLLYLSLAVVFTLSCDSESASSAGPGSTGQGGSLARFAIANNHLYAVNGTRLKVFDITDPQAVKFRSEDDLNVNVETLFPRDAQTLFVGTTSGMYIYDISQPPAITQLGMYEHIVSCDPVVANDRYAFVTLRSSMNNDACNRSVNQLDVIDIRNLTQPELVESYAMKHPIGLGLYGDTLLVCDDGLKVMDATDVLNLNLIHHNTSLPAVDIIPFGNLMIIATETGFAQYRYKNGQLKFLSSL